jgi:SAM-dependent methyltransferase
MIDHPRPDDQYSRVNYRRLIAWEKRIAREAPFLRSLLNRAPERSVIDLGCGTGEHVAFFTDDGARAVGLDCSEAMIRAAKDHEEAGKGRFVLGDATRARAALGSEPPFGLGICLGNVLPPHLTKDEDLAGFFASAHDVLLPGGLLLIQILNYEGILATGKRSLPVNVRPGDDGKEIVFLRLMSPLENGRVLFFPTTLELDPEAEEPLTVKTSRRVEVRPWTRADLAPALGAAGFAAVFHGDMAGGRFDVERSDDLIVVATRE